MVYLHLAENFEAGQRSSWKRGYYINSARSTGTRKAATTPQRMAGEEDLWENPYKHGKNVSARRNEDYTTAAFSLEIGSYNLSVFVGWCCKSEQVQFLNRWL